jgi:transcriptional regulator with XRE-family HTH domain
LKNPLRAFREALGMSRNQLAGAVGKSPQTLEKYEAEAPADLIADLKRYAASVNRRDAIALLTQDAPAPLAHRTSAPTPAIPIPDYPDPSETYGIPRSDWHRMLDQILDSQANHLVIAIVTNLLAFGRDADSIRSRKPGKEAPRYEAYEARVLSALSRLMSTDTNDQLVKDIAAFLAAAKPEEREIVEKQIKLWKDLKRANELKSPKGNARHDDPQEEASTRPQHGRKAV